MFGGSVWTEPMTKPDLNDREIGYEALAWDDEIAEACRSL